MAVHTLTWRHRVRIGQREPVSRVVKFRIEPIVDPVTLLARGRELSSYMVRICGLLVVLCMAAVTLSREATKLTGGRAFVTRFAIHSCMSAN